MANILYGLHIGEHGFEVDKVLDELKENCVARGMNFVTLRTGKTRDPIPKKNFVEWASYLAENKVYFMFLYTIAGAPDGQKSQLTPEIVGAMKEVAGDYFMGDMLGELGTLFCGRMPGYYLKDGGPAMPVQNMPDMQCAKEQYIDTVRAMMEIEREVGVADIGVSVVEASVLSSYNLEAGTSIPLAELMPYDPEALVASVRGAARAYRKDTWGTYVAHEWYAGHYHDDPLKRKRLELEYKYAYMSGTRVLCHESGDELITAHGRRHERDSDVSTECRNFVNAFGEYIKKDKRPVGDPTVKVAFMQGNLDSWTGKGRSGAVLGSSVWGQYEGEEWAYNTPEWSWSILSEIGKKRQWWEFDGYAADGCDLSALPAYGTYDLLPASAPADVMAHYDTVIYCGWNTMTADQLERLESFVEQGGTLLMTAAHLNASAQRAGEYIPANGGDFSRLFGCKLTGELSRPNLGVKFRADSAVSGVLYPRTLGKGNDPLYAMGHAAYATAELCGGEAVATLEDAFSGFDHPGTPAVIEHRLGKGVAILMTTAEYPGHNAVYPLYRFMVRELMRAGAQNARVRVAAPDAVRYTVYEDGSVYLLNTDFDATVTAEVRTDGFTKIVTLAPLALEHVQLGIG